MGPLAWRCTLPSTSVCRRAVDAPATILASPSPQPHSMHILGIGDVIPAQDRLGAGKCGRGGGRCRTSTSGVVASTSLSQPPTVSAARRQMTAVIARCEVSGLVIRIVPTRQSGAAIPVCCPRLIAPGVRSAVVSGVSPTGLRLARGYGVVLRGTESLLTHRWRGMDSNFQFRAR